MMPSTIPGPDRHELRFKEAVLTAFAFVAESGFRCVEARPTFVRFESPEAFVNVYHGRASYEVGIEVGPLAFDPATVGRGFLLDELLAQAGVPESTLQGRTASTPDSVNAIVSQLAELVRRYALAALRADPRTFEALAEIRARTSRGLLERMTLEDARKAASTAWQAQDYAGVVTAYQPVSDRLSPSERKRLAYALKKVEGRER